MVAGTEARVDRPRELSPCCVSWENPEAMRIVPADATIADLEKKALEYELAAKNQPEAATGFKKLAALCHSWVDALKSRAWIP